MAKNKGSVKIITLKCTENGRSAYQTKKNTKTHPERLELLKYNASLRRRTLHREVKK